MRRDNNIVELLNDVLTSELTSINQYFVDAKMLANWGYERLAEKLRDESISDMKDADELIGRILFLEGVPNLQRLGTLQVGEDVAEKLQAALSLEYESIERLNNGIAACVAAGDNGTRELLDDILEEEEEFTGWLETQHELIRQVGDAHYLAQQIHD